MQMLNPFVCGTFNPEDGDELCLANPASSSSPKKYKRKNNPYSSRGLEKFSALLSDLNEKRQKIYSQMNPHDISFVRFVHSNTDDFVPIIVKVKNKDQKNMKSQEVKGVKPRNLTESTASIDQPMEERKLQKLESEKKATKKGLSVSWNMNVIDMEKPFFYLPFVVIMILVLLTLFGRSAATIFTCVLWYVIPTLKEYNSSSKTRELLVKKKEYVRGVSEKKMVVSSNNEGVSKKKECVRGVSSNNEGVSKKKECFRGVSSNNEGVVSKKKEYVRGVSEKKMVVNEVIKKKDFCRRWSEKKMATDGLLSSPRSGGDDSSEANAKNKTIQAKHSHKKSW